MMVLSIAAIITVITILILLAPLMLAGGRQALCGWALLFLLTIGAMGTYLWRGAPDIPAEPVLFDHSSPRYAQRQALKKEIALAAELESRPDDPALMLKLGELRLANGRLAEAIAILSRAHEKYPGETAIILKLGAAHYAAALAALLLEDDRAGAQEYFDKALAIAPPDAPYRQRLEQDYTRFQEEDGG